MSDLSQREREAGSEEYEVSARELIEAMFSRGYEEEGSLALEVLHRDYGIDLFDEFPHIF